MSEVNITDIREGSAQPCRRERYQFRCHHKEIGLSSGALSGFMMKNMLAITSVSKVRFPAGLKSSSTLLNSLKRRSSLRPRPPVRSGQRCVMPAR